MLRKGLWNLNQRNRRDSGKERKKERRKQCNKTILRKLVSRDNPDYHFHQYLAELWCEDELHRARFPYCFVRLVYKLVVFHFEEFLRGRERERAPTIRRSSGSKPSTPRLGEDVGVRIRTVPPLIKPTSWDTLLQQTVRKHKKHPI